jgi:hypothetical protein
LDVTRFHPVLVSLAAFFLAGSFIFLAYAKEILTKMAFQKINGKADSIREDESR